MIVGCQQQKLAVLLVRVQAADLLAKAPSLAQVSLAEAATASAVAFFNAVHSREFL